MTVKLDSNPQFPGMAILDWRLESRSPLAARLQSLAAVQPTPEVPYTMLKVELPQQGTAELKQWKKWYRSHPSEIATFRIVDSSGGECWVDAAPARVEAEPFQWLGVVHLAVDHFKDRLSIGEAPTLHAISSTAKDVKDKQRAQKPLTKDEEAFLKASNALRGLIQSSRQNLPCTPQEVVDWYSSPRGYAPSLITAWKVYLNSPLNPAYNERSHVVRLLETAERRMLSRSSTIRCLENSLAVQSQLTEAARTFRGIVRAEATRSKGPFSAPNYSITVDHILGEFLAFVHGARKAAAHETVYGSLIENRLREFVTSSVTPLSVSSGAIAGAPYKQQLDLIIWDHTIMPAVISQGDVAVVPPQAIVGILEIKASANLGSFATRMEDLRDEIALLRRRTPAANVPVPLMGLVVADAKPYDEVRRTSTSVLTSLFCRLSTYEWTPNPRGAFDLMTFLYDRVLPCSRTLRSSVAQKT